MARQTNIPDVGFPDLLVDLSAAPRRALRQTFEHAVREQIQSGRLRPGELLPPTRTLAAQLGVSRSVVLQAYANLAVDGYLEPRQGSGTRVRADPGDAAPPVTARTEDPSAFFGPDRTAPLIEARARVRLLGGTPDPTLFPRARWARHYRAALAALPDRDLLYPPTRGNEALRAAIGAYLSRVRGIAHAAERLIVCAGITQGITITCRALRRLGARRIAVEEPCFGPHRTAIAMTGLEPVPVPVDAGGLDVGALAGRDVDAVLVAPAHSFPTGSALEPRRREALVKWARQRGAIVIEDDYDAELRYDRSPTGALQGMAPERVVCIGSVSKTLAPALRIGWLIPPAELVDAIECEKRFDDMGSTALEQEALARFVASGDFARHLRRVRPIYRRRRDTAIRMLTQLLPDATSRGAAAGLHVYVELGEPLDMQALGVAMYDRGVVIEDAARHWADPSGAGASLVLGYGGHPEPALRQALRLLARTVAEMRDAQLLR